MKLGQLGTGDIFLYKNKDYQGRIVDVVIGYNNQLFYWVRYTYKKAEFLTIPQDLGSVGNLFTAKGDVIRPTQVIKTISRILKKTLKFPL